MSGFLGLASAAGPKREECMAQISDRHRGNTSRVKRLMFCVISLWGERRQVERQPTHVPYLISCG